MKKHVLLTIAAAAVLGLCACNGNGAKTSSTTPAASSQAGTSSAATTSTPAASSAAGSSAAGSSATVSSSTPVATVNKITEVVAEGTYTVKGVVVAVGPDSVLFDDGEGRIVYYNKGKCADYVIGDYYKIAGAVTKAANYRYGNFQFTSTAVLTQLNKASAPTVGATAAEYDKAAFIAWADSMKADAKSGWTEGTSAAKGLEVTKRPLVKTQVKVTTSVSGTSTYINGYYGDYTTYDVGFTGTAAMTAALTAGNGKFFNVTGYFYEVVAQKHCYIFVTAYEQVVIAPTSVAVTAADSATFVRVGEKVQLSAVVLPDGADQGVTWSSSNTAAATIDAATGEVTGVAVATGVEFSATSTANTAIVGKVTLDVHEANLTPITAVTIAEGATYSLPVGVVHTFGVSVLPAEANQTVAWASSDTAIATVDASTGAVTPVAAGTANITATSVGKDASDKVVVATLALTVTAEPGVKDLTIAQLSDWVASQDKTKTVLDNESYYTISGILEGKDSTNKYGNAYLTDPATGKSVTVYGSTTTATAFAFAAGVIKFTNPQDAVTTLADYKNGEMVTMKVQRESFKGVAEVMGIMTAHVADTTKYTATINTPENGTATLDVVKDLAYGATVTVTCVPASGYKVSSVNVTTDYGVVPATATATANVYTFTANCHNDVVVTFADANTCLVSFDSAFNKDFTSISTTAWSKTTSDGIVVAGGIVASTSATWALNSAKTALSYSAPIRA